jgi:hypothetical protein
MFHAGCAGDVLTGVFGDPQNALDLEGYGLLLLTASAASGSAAVIFMSQSPHRIAHGVGLALLILVCLWLSGIQVEMWGVRSCF